MIKLLQAILSLIASLFISVFSHAQGEYMQATGIKDSISSVVLDQYRTYYVHLPGSYDKMDDVHYPVVYVLDGHNLANTVVDVQNYYSGGFTPEMIIVGISNAKNRVRDLTISQTSMYPQVHGKSDDFRKFITQELMPLIDKNYKTTSYRTLIGHSYGGLFTLDLMVKEPQLFKNYLAIDPSTDWDDQKLIKDAQSLLESADFKGRSLFISLNGQLHMADAGVTIENVMEDDSFYTLFARSNITYTEQLKSADTGLEITWKFYPDEFHGTIPFPSIRDGLVEFFDWYQMEDTYKINDFETSTADLKAIIEHRADKLEQHFGYFVAPYPEELLNVMGYMSMDMGQADKAELYFQYAIEYYPNSYNAYDSMGEYYTKMDKPEKADAYYKKAQALSKAK